jgi:Polysaccharide lyase family 4, domain II
MNGSVRFTFAALLTALVGCDPAASTAPTQPPSPSRSTHFDPAHTGTLQGRVTWKGALPSVPDYRSPANPLALEKGNPWLNWYNPHAPVIDAKSRAIAGAVVFLDAVEPDASRPWEHPPVRVAIRDHRFHVFQGETETPGAIGFVRRGDTVEFVSRQDAFFAIQLRGARFYSLPFPDRDKPRTLCLDTAGIVELISGSGQFWTRGYLFVSDHPYFARTDAQGQFTLPSVPPGKYRLTCWLADWREESRELDADTGLLWRVTYRPPFHVSQPARVETGRNTTVDFTLD